MNDFIKEKLHVEIDDNLENPKCIETRHYTLTHSDETGELFLFIDMKYREEEFSHHRDEVLASWEKIEDKYFLNIFLCVDGEKEDKNVEDRDIIFREELPLALAAIVYGDKNLYLENEELLNAPIIVYFNSKDKQYNRVERWGEVSDYFVKMDRVEGSFKFPQNIVNSRMKDGVIFTLLSSYIEKEMKKIYGPRFIYCPNFSEILSIRSLNAPLACRGRYLVIVKVKQGLNMSNKQESIIEFLISTEGVKVQSVKNPR